MVVMTSIFKPGELLPCAIHVQNIEVKGQFV